MFESMREYEPREILFEALGMVEGIRMLDEDASIAVVLEDVAHHIKWVLKNTNMYKKEQTAL